MDWWSVETVFKVFMLFDKSFYVEIMHWANGKSVETLEDECTQTKFLSEFESVKMFSLNYRKSFGWHFKGHKKKIIEIQEGMILISSKVIITTIHGEFKATFMAQNTWIFFFLASRKKKHNIGRMKWTTIKLHKINWIFSFSFLIIV